MSKTSEDRMSDGLKVIIAGAVGLLLTTITVGYVIFKIIDRGML